MKFLNKHSKRFYSQIFNDVTNISKEDSLKQFRKIIYEEGVLNREINSSSYNSNIKKLIKNAYNSLNFNEKILTTELFLSSNKLNIFLYNENLELLKNEEYYKEFSNLQYIYILVQYLEHFNEKITIKDINILFRNITKYYSTKLKLTNDSHFSLVLKCMNIENKYNIQNNKAYESLTNYFYEGIKNNFIDNYRKNSIPNENINKLLFAFEKNRYRDNNFNSILVDIILDTDLNQINYLVVLLLVQNHGLLKSSRLNEFIYKLRNEDILSTSKNKFEKALFFKILCYLHSFCENEIIHTLIKNYLGNEKSNEVFCFNNIKNEKNTKYVNLLLPLAYINSLKIFSPDILNKVNNLLIEYINHKIYHKNIITRFHRDVLSILLRLDLDYEVENLDNFTSKDIILKNHRIDEQRVCLELNGEHHFYRDNQKNYQTEFKKKILCLNNWKVIDIAHMDWKSLDEEKKLAFVSNLIKI